MNPKYDLHMHTFYSDGSQSFEDIFKKVKEIGLKCFGVTDHYEVGHNYTVKENPEKYYAHFLKIKEEAEKFGITALIGAEIGFNDLELLKPKNLPEIDYIIGSVHQMPQELEEKEYWNLYRKYLENAVTKYDFQILGHAEGYLPVNKFMKSGSNFEDRRKYEKIIAKKYFSLEWYKDLAKEMNKNEIALEIHEMSESPRLEVINLMIENGVKLTYGTDSHANYQLAKRDYFKKVLNELELNDENFLDIEAVRRK
jgi:HisJ family histidinol phosphate phosphatase